MDFLTEKNSCGQKILRLVSRGNSIIAELLRLKDYIPPVFKLESKADQVRYSEILFDFGYFNSAEAFERKVDNNPVLRDADDEFRENYAETVGRFYAAFESIHTYVSDLDRFVADLNDGVYIQQTVESVFRNVDGSQLMCEALYLYGVMLLIVDRHFDGLVRERLLIAYYRYSGHRPGSGSNVDDVCKLLRSTGCSFCGSAAGRPTAGTRPPNYPESYFKRMTLDATYIEMVVGRLRSDDIYHQMSAYPLPEHRSTAVATQAAMLYICLYFVPNVLHNQTARMRETVDRFFPDNWVISVYMGVTVNLIEWWEPYKAAKMALANTLDSSNIHEQAKRHSQKLKKLVPQTQQLLKEGVLKEETLLESTNRIFSVIRDCNVTLRWLLLHTTQFGQLSVDINSKKCRQVREQVLAEGLYDSLLIFELLLNTAQLELKVKDLYRLVLSDKEPKWNAQRDEVGGRITELAEVFSGARPLARISKNENLQAWFKEIAGQIEQLSFKESQLTSQKIIQLVQALEEVLEFHQLESELHVRQFLSIACQSLRHMLRTLSANEQDLVVLQIIGDLSYAWELIDVYTPNMQQGLKKDPALAINLRATFLKLSSAMDLPLMRINQAHSGDLVSVSQYYSGVLVAYIRRVLQIVPETVFGLVDRVVHLLTSKIKEVPARLEKEHLRDYAQLEDRREVARLTHAISTLTEGVLAMKTTLVGVVCLDPKLLLEDGIRKELVRQVAAAFHENLSFNPKAKQSELLSKLKVLSQIMDGYRRSFEYVQDYVSVSGLRLWQEEVSRIVAYNVEQECNSFLRTKVQDWESIYQSISVPIPKFPPTDSNSVTFVGRLAREIIKITDPKITVYASQTSAWYEVRNHAEVANPKLFASLELAVGTFGLTGLDRLLSFMIVTQLQDILKCIQKKILLTKQWQEQLQVAETTLLPTTRLISSPAKTYIQIIGKLNSVWQQILDFILAIGQLQLLRRHIARQLANCCQFDSQHLANALQAFNEALLADIEAHYKNPDKKPYPSEESPLLYELSSYLDSAGMGGDPLSKIYITGGHLPDHVPLLLALFAISQMPKFMYQKTVCGLTSKRPQDAVDGVPFVLGMTTLLKQLHHHNVHQFKEYIMQFINSHTETSVATADATNSAKLPEIPVDSLNAGVFMENFISTYSVKPGKLPGFFNLGMPYASQQNPAGTASTAIVGSTTS